MGISIAIDDFGTGYSSLSYLRQYRVHVLKIDRSFVAEIECSQQARVIPQAVVALGRALKLRTVAEGVETDGQAEILRGMGCDLLQGYGIGRPLDQAATEALLLSRGMLDQATA
jgi:EAL domain-containing protein (putative c-di-GMP-specific phosphodiesterase class I)